MDAVTYIVTSAIVTLVGLVLLYFVIKAAVKNALIEDRAFQAKVQKMRAEVPAAGATRRPSMSAPSA